MLYIRFLEGTRSLRKTTGASVLTTSVIFTCNRGVICSGLCKDMWMSLGGLAESDIRKVTAQSDDSLGNSGIRGGIRKWSQCTSVWHIPCSLVSIQVSHDRFWVKLWNSTKEGTSGVSCCTSPANELLFHIYIYILMRGIFKLTFFFIFWPTSQSKSGLQPTVRLNQTHCNYCTRSTLTSIH